MAERGASLKRVMNRWYENFDIEPEKFIQETKA
jgi:hypothetical protein